MPNHVANILTIRESKERVIAFLEAVKGEESAFDFNRIIPKPETYKKYDTTNHPNGKGLVAGQPYDPFDEKSVIVTEELIEEFKQATLEQYTKYGVVGWYDWSRLHWGTKWNAYDVEVDGDSIFFNTAWAEPKPIYLKLAQMFPDYNFSIVFASEEMGCGAGNVEIVSGEVSYIEAANGSDVAMKYYFATHPGMEDVIIKNEKGEWVWKDED